MRFVLRQRRFEHFGRCIHSGHSDFALNREERSRIFFKIGDGNGGRVLDIEPDDQFFPA